jgi:hypothetical protein
MTEINIDRQTLKATLDRMEAGLALTPEEVKFLGAVIKHALNATSPNIVTRADVLDRDEVRKLHHRMVVLEDLSDPQEAEGMLPGLLDAALELDDARSRICVLKDELAKLVEHIELMDECQELLTDVGIDNPGNIPISQRVSDACKKLESHVETEAHLHRLLDSAGVKKSKSLHDRVGWLLDPFTKSDSPGHDEAERARATTFLDVAERILLEGGRVRLKVNGAWRDVNGMDDVRQLRQWVERGCTITSYEGEPPAHLEVVVAQKRKRLATLTAQKAFTLNEVAEKRALEKELQWVQPDIGTPPPLRPGQFHLPTAEEWDEIKATLAHLRGDLKESDDLEEPNVWRNWWGAIDEYVKACGGTPMADIVESEAAQRVGVLIQDIAIPETEEEYLDHSDEQSLRMLNEVESLVLDGEECRILIHGTWREIKTWKDVRDYRRWVRNGARVTDSDAERVKGLDGVSGDSDHHRPDHVPLTLVDFEEKVAWALAYAASGASEVSDAMTLSSRADAAVRQLRMRTRPVDRSKPPPTSVPDSPRSRQ